MMMSLVVRIVTMLVVAVMGLQIDLAFAAAGTVQVVVGTVRIIQANGQERPAVKGDHLYAGDTVTTAAGSNIQIRMIDDARFWVRPLSRFKIEQYPGDAAAAAQHQAQAATRLIEGSLRAVTGAIGHGAPERYALRTPNAVIGIRGTDFEVAHFGPRNAPNLQTLLGTYHRVYEGQTALTSAGAVALLLRAGQAAFVGMEPGDAPKTLSRIPPFLDLPDGPVSALPPATAPGGGASGSPGMVSGARDAATAAPRALRLGLRMASPLADGATVVSSAGAPVEPIQTMVGGREGETSRLRLTLQAPPSSRQRRAPEPPSTVILDMTARVDGPQAHVTVQDPATGGVLQMTLPLGTWVDISGRASWLAGGRQTTSSSMARPDAAQVMVRVDLATP